MPIEVHAFPQIEPNDARGWDLILWASPGFDYSAPFRLIVDEVANLYAERNPRVELPPHEPNEDFVTGKLTFGEDVIDLYLEYALGYISLSSRSQAVLKDLQSRLAAVIRLKKG
jgi:hypothetical protein